MRKGWFEVAAAMLLGAASAVVVCWALQGGTDAGPAVDLVLPQTAIAQDIPQRVTRQPLFVVTSPDSGRTGVVVGALLEAYPGSLCPAR